MPGGGEPVPADLETVLAALGDLLAHSGTGLLVTIDELHVSGLDEVREFGSVFQLASRRAERPVAFMGAALPELEDRLMAGDASTFLQRCRRHEIGNLRPSEAEIGLRQPIEAAGGRMDDDALRLAVEASRGQPYRTAPQHLSRPAPAIAAPRAFAQLGVGGRGSACV